MMSIFIFVRPAIACKLLELRWTERISYPHQHPAKNTTLKLSYHPITVLKNDHKHREKHHRLVTSEEFPRKVAKMSQHGAGQTYCHCGHGSVFKPVKFSSAEKLTGILETRRDLYTDSHPHRPWLAIQHSHKGRSGEENGLRRRWTHTCVAGARQQRARESARTTHPPPPNMADSHT